MNHNRRVFIKRSAVASAAIAIFPSCVTSSTGSDIPEIGVQLYTVRDAMAKDPRGTLEQVAKIGYKKIETAGYSDGKVYGFVGKEFKSFLDDLGLKLISGHISPQIFEESFDQALDFMVAAGQQYAVFPWLAPEQRETLDQYKGYAETLNKCAEKAKPANIKVCYHNHDFEFQQLEGELPMNILLRELDSELVDIELDLYWITKAGMDPITFFKENRKRVPLWHVKDMADTPEQGFAEVGTGTIDYSNIFAYADVSGMQHFFVEQDQSNDPMQSIQTSYQNLTQKILV